jgi:DNA (cytosine-5)-methyltransferase 1
VNTLDTIAALVSRTRLDLTNEVASQQGLAQVFEAVGIPFEREARLTPGDRIDLADRGDGRLLTKTAQVRLVGNSVCPPVVEALVRANCCESAERRAA